MNKTLFYSKLYSWYEQNHRILPWRETSDAYRIWISEIILQQTRVVQGMEYYHRFVERFPDVASLAAAAEDEVLLYWQGLGYYSRARNLHKAAKQIVNSHDGAKTESEGDAKHKVPFPTTWAELRQLPGIGDYTAGAIASFAYNQAYPALDGNVYRVLSRLYDSDVVFDTSAGKRHFHQLAEELLDHDNPRLFNSAIMEFGALYCTPQSPECEACPLQAFCLGYQHETAELLPIRKPRPTLRNRYLNYNIYLSDQGKTLIRQRKEKDIWQHLYEFPLVEADHLIDHADVPHFDFKHILSHQRLHARFNIYKVSELPEMDETMAISMSELDNYALSRLTLLALEKLHGISKG